MTNNNNIFKLNPRLSDVVMAEMEEYLHKQKINYCVKSVHCICTKCGEFAMFESRPYGVPIQDHYYCDTPVCDNSCCVDDNSDWDLNRFNWVV